MLCGFLVREWQQSSWIGIEPYRMVWVSQENGQVEQVVLISYIPEFQTVIMYQLPSDVYVPTRDHGIYRVGALATLGKITGKGEALFAEAMERTFGVHVDDVFEAREVIGPDTLGSLVRGELLRSVASDANTFDLLRLWWQLRQVIQADVKWIPLGDQNVYYTSTDVDGSRRREVYTPLLDDIQYRTIPPAHTLFFQSQVVVVNGAGKGGLATALGRVLTAEGFDLIRVENADSPMEKTRILYTPDLIEPDKTLLHLSQITGIEERIQTNTDSYRADVVVLLGSDATKLD
jgi:hypothetical protein